MIFLRSLTFALLSKGEEEWLPQTNNEHTSHPKVAQLLVMMYKYRGKHTRIIFGEPLLPETTPSPEKIFIEKTKLK